MYIETWLICNKYIILFLNLSQDNHLQVFRGTIIELMFFKFMFQSVNI